MSENFSSSGRSWKKNTAGNIWKRWGDQEVLPKKHNSQYLEALGRPGRDGKKRQFPVSGNSGTSWNCVYFSNKHVC